MIFWFNCNAAQFRVAQCHEGELGKNQIPYIIALKAKITKKIYASGLTPLSLSLHPFVTF